MKLVESTPTLQEIYYFKYFQKKGNYPTLSHPKTQYGYRLMYLAAGECVFCVGEKKIRMTAGDVLYLQPGAVYQMFPLACDFSTYSIFFSFSSQESARTRAYYIFAEDYQEGLASPRLRFTDAPVLNESGVIGSLDDRVLIPSLSTLWKSDEVYSFHANAALSYLLSLLLRKKNPISPKFSAVEPILSYIRENPDRKLSGDALSKRFLYHKNHINRLVKESTGKTLAEYIRSAKIDYAKAVLSEGGTSLTELALMLGYYDYSHFYRAFVLETGMAPSAYQKKSD